ncbi:MAG: hypothetical protein E7670_01565 [Ruminococcaceae bacterium]|nr:hypothetical protein [Oscillospiraceae bacterium]
MKDNITSKVHPAILERKRIASWWLRFEDLNWPNPDAHDRIKRRAEAMAKANVTTAMVFGTHFRWDFLPYFTILHDYLATVAEELGKYGVELFDHHSVNLIHRYSTREEMRHVILHSGPHLPFSPSWEAAASWEYNGSRLNTWRMIDVETRKPLWYPQYAAESFCMRNPDYREAYKSYLTKLISETGIKGVSCDDPIHYMHYRSCACPHCLAEFKRRTGLDLPPVSDLNFWGNWENEAWKAWIDMRFDGAVDFWKYIKPVFPEGFRVMTCGANSAAAKANSSTNDARCSLMGCNYVNLEMSGNTPPYKHDTVTWNRPIASRLVTSSHHRAAAKEKGVRCFATGFAFVEETANIVWAVNKMLDSDAWVITLKDRLGLPERILKTLPNESDIVGKAFGYEKDHPELFMGDHVGQLAVYFSYETRKHSYFGNLEKGYYKDYDTTLRTLFTKGISPHTVFDFPTDITKYPLVLVPSAAVMTDKEKAAMELYVKNGGVIIATGPCTYPSCKNEWKLPTNPALTDYTDFFNKNPDTPGATGAWTNKNTVPPSKESKEWQSVAERIYYNPHRISDGEITESFIELVNRFITPMPVKMIDSRGYLVTMFESDDAITVHLLSEDYDTDIDHELDDMRFHRSRVNFINKVEPIGITEVVKLESKLTPKVYTPFNEEAADISEENGVFSIRLPEKTSYAILRFEK